MIIQDDWRNFIYNKAKNEVISGKFKSRYKPVYDKMRDIGVENYNIDDMDISFITEVIRGCREIAPTNKKTRDAMEPIFDDKNIKSHSNQNEDDEELYLYGLLSLCNLRKFVRIVDDFETQIEDECRVLYRKTYISKIQELMEKLDQERIQLKQKNKDIESDINKIFESEDKLNAFWNIERLYFKRYFEIEKNIEYYDEFMIKASDAGIVYAHSRAAEHFFITKNDYIEGEKRLLKLLNSYDKLPVDEVYMIIYIINDYLSKNFSLTEGMVEIVNRIIKQGFKITKTDNGMYVLKKNIEYSSKAKNRFMKSNNNQL